MPRATIHLSGMRCTNLIPSWLMIGIRIMCHFKDYSRMLDRERVEPMCVNKGWELTSCISAVYCNSAKMNRWHLLRTVRSYTLLILPNPIACSRYKGVYEVGMDGLQRRHIWMEGFLDIVRAAVGMWDATCVIKSNNAWHYMLLVLPSLTVHIPNACSREQRELWESVESSSWQLTRSEGSSFSLKYCSCCWVWQCLTLHAACVTESDGTHFKCKLDGAEELQEIICSLCHIWQYTLSESLPTVGFVRWFICHMRSVLFSVIYQHILFLSSALTTCCSCWLLLYQISYSSVQIQSALASTLAYYSLFVPQWCTFHITLPYTQPHCKVSLHWRLGHCAVRPNPGLYVLLLVMGSLKLNHAWWMVGSSLYQICSGEWV